MQALALHPFFQAIGFAIVHSLWQSAFLWLVYFLINSLFRLTPHQKYALATVAQLMALFCFIYTLLFFKGINFTASIFTVSGLESSTAYAYIFHYISSERFLSYLAFPYLIILIFGIVKWFIAYRYTSYVKNNGNQKINVEWRLFVQHFSMHLGIKNKVSIYISHIVSTPLTIGFLKPVILIPLACINSMNTQQMEAVILHELAHIRRKDYFINLLLSLGEIILFFNPFIRLLSNSIKEERENCCDDWVLQYQYDPVVYASALLSIAAPSPMPALALYASDKKLLLARIKRILQQPPKTKNSYKALMLACLALITFPGIIFLSEKKYGDAKPEAGILATFSENRSFINHINKKESKQESAENIRFYTSQSVSSKHTSSITLHHKRAVSNTLRKALSIQDKEIGNNLAFAEDLTTYILRVKAAKNQDALAQLKAGLPIIIAQLSKEIDISNTKISAAKHFQIEQAIASLQHYADELYRESFNYNVLNIDKINHDISALFAMPSSIDEVTYTNLLFGQIAPAKMEANNKKTFVQQSQKIIIIELPASVSDTITQHQATPPKVLKITKI